MRQSVIAQFLNFEYNDIFYIIPPNFFDELLISIQ